MTAAKRRIAVVLFNLGGPDGLKAVRPFLFNLFRDPAILSVPALARYPLAALITAVRTKLAKANYAYMGGFSPLLGETLAQAGALQSALQAQLADDETRVFTAMRYWRPFTGQVAREVAAWGPDEIVLLPLYPQYSTTTTGSSLKAWREAYRGPGRSHAVCCYYAETGFIEAHVRRIREAWEAAGRPENVRLLFSAHGLPERVIQAGDPYQWQVEATCRAVAERLQWPWGWQVCYQSRVGPMKWIGPLTPDAIAEACRDGMGVLIDPIAFVSEHVETLVELDRDYAALAEKLGCPAYLRAATVGVEAAFISGLARTVTGALERPGLEPQGPVCEARLTACPRLAPERAAA
jgi:ferrochelatase